MYNVTHACTHACTHPIGLSRDPSTRHLEGQFQIWMGEIFRGRVTTRHSVMCLYDGCHHNVTCFLLGMVVIIEKFH
jgi:hypothetical protein